MDWIIIVYSIMFFFGIYFLLLFIILYKRYKHEMLHFVVPKKLPVVSFITPAYNEEDSIAETINALLEVDYPKGKKEIIIVNDGSTDRTADIVRGFMKKYIEIKLLDKENSGKANSLNEAIKIAKGGLIAIVDADAYPTKDSLKKMIGYFDEKKVAAVTSRVLVKNRKNLIEKFQHIDYIVIAWSRKILDFIDSVYVTNGPLSIYRKELIKKVGGFDPNNITEDIEITWHLLSKGYKTKMAYDAIAYTAVPSTLSAWIKQRIRWNIGGLQTLYKYRKSFLRGKNAFGYFVITYVGLAFFLAFIGFILMLRYIYMKAVVYLPAIFYIPYGYNPLRFIEFNLNITLLLILGLTFFTLSIIYYSLSLQGSGVRYKFFTTIIFIFVYRPLYLIPYLIAIYKIIKRDIRWYTK